MKIVFIASPFRADTTWLRAENVRHAERAALAVWKAGACAVCPQANSANLEGECDEEVFLAGYRALLERCDAVLVAGRESDGVRLEFHAARRAGIPVFYTVPEVAIWLSGAVVPANLERP